MKQGDILRLTGKTLKGKNTVGNFGPIWSVYTVCDSVAFSPRTGPWALIKTDHTSSARWIHCIDDKDFDVENITHMSDEDD